MSTQKFHSRKAALIAALIAIPALALLVLFVAHQKNSSSPSPTTSVAQQGEQTPAGNAAQKSPSSVTGAVTETGSVPSSVGKSSTEAKSAADSKASAPSATAPATAMAPALPSSATAPVAPAKPAVVEEPQGCVTIAYHHKKAPGHTDEESCSQHQNLLTLKHANPSSLCVRVNKTPVRFERVKGHPDQVLIAGIAGPKSEITVRYCFGKATCNEDCTIPKDEFMDAIGGIENEKAGKVAKWDANDGNAKDADVNAHLDHEMKHELDNLDRQVRGENGIFADWIGGNETAACGAKLVAKGN